MLSTTLGWGLFSFQPVKTESTPNYYGINPEVVAGYSVRQRFDLAAVANYMPASYGATNPSHPQTALTFYGGQIAIRPAAKLFLGIRAGNVVYQFLKTAHAANEVPGTWMGTGYGLSLGSLFEVDRQKFWQISVELLHMMIARKSSLQHSHIAYNGPKERQMDAFRVSVTYTFNGFINHAIAGSVFENVFFDRGFKH